MRAVYLILSGVLVFTVVSAPAQPVLSETRHEFVFQGLTVIETRVLNEAASTIERQALTPDGVAVNVDELARREEQLRTLHFRKMSSDLNDRIANAASPAMPIEVAFWLNLPDLPDFRLVLEAARAKGLTEEDARRVARNTAEQFLSPHTQAFAHGLLARGYEVTHTGVISLPPIVRHIRRNIAMPASSAAWTNSVLSAGGSTTRFIPSGVSCRLMSAAVEIRRE